MKVVIELIGNESRGDLLATSNYLRELAEGSLPVSTEAKVHDPNYEAKVYNPNAKTDLDKLADAVVEATKVKDEEKPKTVSEMVESERAKTRAKRAAKPAPAEEPAAEEPAAEEPAAEEPAAEEPAAEEPAAEEKKVPQFTIDDCKAAEEKKAPQFTIDDCKAYAMKALNAKKRPIVQEAFEHVGASSFPTLKESMFNDFVKYISTRL